MMLYFTSKRPMNISKWMLSAGVLLIGMFVSLNICTAQRTNWGIMLNGGTVYLPAAYRYDVFTGMPAGSRGEKREFRPAVTAPLVGLGIHTYTRIYEFNPENSVGLMVNPMGAIYIPYAAGSGWDLFDIVDFYGLPVMMQLPLMLHFAHGMFSTVLSTKHLGWGVSAGVESSLFLDGADRRNSARYAMPSTFWVRPAVAVQLRYWNRKDRPRELSFQFSTHRDAYTDIPVTRPMFKVSYGGYWNY